MQFEGNAVRVTQKKVEEIARQLDTSVAKVLAVVAVEARGRGFAGKTGLTIQALFERHKFYAELAKKGDKVKLAKAVSLGLASKKRGGYPKTLEGVIAKVKSAMAIDEDAALRSTSWGMGQIMGFNCRDVGYATAREMVEAFLTGEDAQIQAMADFIVHNGLDDELRRGDWRGFARGYNGPSFEENDYDGKLAAKHAALAKKFPEGLADTIPQDADIVRMGQKGPLVRELQQLLTKKGFPVGEIDEDFGGKTKRAVRLFQLDQGLEGTGRVDQETWNRLHAARDEVQPEARQEATEKDLERKSPVVRQGLSIRRWALWAIGLVTGGKGLDESGALDGADGLVQGMGKVQQVVEAAKPLVLFAKENLWLVAVVALGVVCVAAHRVVSARVADYREGRA